MLVSLCLIGKCKLGDNYLVRLHLLRFSRILPSAAKQGPLSCQPLPHIEYYSLPAQVLILKCYNQPQAS